MAPNPAPPPSKAVCPRGPLPLLHPPPALAAPCPKGFPGEPLLQQLARSTRLLSSISGEAPMAGRAVPTLTEDGERGNLIFARVPTG